MTAQRIREAQQAAFNSMEERAFKVEVDFKEKLEGAKIDVLFEIAAQLAEMNEREEERERRRPVE